MPNGIISELDFEKRISEMPDRQLLEFVARQTFEVTNRCKVYDKEIGDLKSGDKRISGITGGISGTITSIVIGVIGYFTNRSQ